MQDHQRQFIELAIAGRVLRFGEFTLKSGRVSPYFFNAGLFNTGGAIAAVGHCYGAAIAASGIEFDMLFGPAYKGIPIVTAAADTPFFPTDLVARLTASAGPSGLCLAASPDETGRVQRQPTFGLWPVALRDDLRAALTGGLRKIVIWTNQHQAGEAVFDSVPFDPFFNVNTPEDIVAAEALVGAA